MKVTKNFKKCIHNLQLSKICSIIEVSHINKSYFTRTFIFSFQKNIKKECGIIISKKVKYYTKEFTKILNIALLGLALIVGIILIKYQPMYSVEISGEKVGYLKNKEDFNKTINKEILESDEQNVDFVSINVTPQYKIKLVNRNEATSEDIILSKLKENITVTYKFYEIALNDTVKTYVNTLEEATNVVNEIKEEYNGNKEELNLQIIEKYTENKEEAKTDSIEIAKSNLNKKIDEQIEKEEENTIATINGIKIAAKPVNGIITSRYGESSSRRRSTHTGLDIACKTGTPIKVVSDGKVTFAGKKGSYGNLVKVEHGNGIETWYAHCYKITTSVGTNVKAGDIIATVGSTGNSTGSHLHLEIRINGETINPQKYLYN